MLQVFATGLQILSSLTTLDPASSIIGSEKQYQLNVKCSHRPPAWECNCLQLVAKIIRLDSFGRRARI